MEKSFLTVVLFCSFSKQVIHGTTFFANYQPSLNTVGRVATNDLWPGFITPHDTGTESSLGSGQNYIGAWRVGNTGGFSFASLSTDFVAPSSFTASYITFPARFNNSFPNFDTLTAVAISEIDPVGGNTLLGSTRVRVNTLSPYSPEFVDYTLPFGSNVTGGSGGFVPEPVVITAGSTYRISFGGVPAGSAGAYEVANSTTLGSGTNTMVDASFNSDAFQPAFALNDGTNSVIPEASGPLLWGISLLGAALRRRRAKS